MSTELTPFTRRQFLRTTGMAITAAAIAPARSLNAADHTGVPAIRLERLSKGANVCRWFRFIRHDQEEHFKNYVTESEAKAMRQMGLSHIRLCLQPRVVMNQTSGALLEDNVAFVEAAIARFHRAGLLVVIDLHNEDRPSELNSDWQNAFVRFWEAFAARLRHFDPDLTVFEIINEPVFASKEGEWNTLNTRLAAAIRKSAPSHTIMTSGPNWGGIDGLKKLKLLEEPNIVYSFHCYDPFAFTHQGATWAGPDVKPLREVPYPSNPQVVAPLIAALSEHPGSQKMLEKYGRDNWNKAKLAARFKQGIEWGLANKVPLYCGEFGVFPPYAKPEHRANWFRDFGQVLADNQIGWSVWGWDEGFGLNRKYSEGKLVVDLTVASALGLKA